MTKFNGLQLSENNGNFKVLGTVEEYIIDAEPVKTMVTPAGNGFRFELKDGSAVYLAFSNNVREALKKGNLSFAQLKHCNISTWTRLDQSTGETRNYQSITLPTVESNSNVINIDKFLESDVDAPTVEYNVPFEVDAELLSAVTAGME